MFENLIDNFRKSACDCDEEFTGPRSRAQTGQLINNLMLINAYKNTVDGLVKCFTSSNCPEERVKILKQIKKLKLKIQNIEISL